MRRHKVLGIKLLCLILIFGNTVAEGTFEDTDKLNDLSSSNHNQHFDLRHTIPGEPEIDYPIYSAVPKTSFVCSGRHEGYYADVESRCQAFRICTHTARSVHGFGFLCPNGTLFSQKLFVCDWYRNVNCDESENHFDKNSANRVGSSFDMMETVRQMMEYPMKTISKALRQNTGVAARRPTHAQRSRNRTTTATTEVTASKNNSPAQRNTGRKTAVTRAQVESAHNQATTPEDITTEVTPSQSVPQSEAISNEGTTLDAQEQSKAVVTNSDDVYVNSLGELSSDPGVHFDRTNAHIIAESPRSYYYKKMNFAEKVNAGLNELVELPSDDLLAPDYVKTLRGTKDEATQVDLASNINGLLDEIAGELDTSVSGYQVATPPKTKHSFKFLSRGFSAQSDRAKDAIYGYNGAKHATSSAKLSPNELSNDSHKDTFETQKIHKNSTEDKKFTIMTSSPKPPTTSPLAIVEDEVYREPVTELPETEQHVTSNELDPTAVTTFRPKLEDINLLEHTDSPLAATNAALVFDTTTTTADEESTDGIPSIVEDIETHTDIAHNEESTTELNSEGAEVTGEKVDAHKQAADLLLAGIKLTSHDDDNLADNAEATQIPTDPLLIRVDDEPSNTDASTSKDLAAPVTVATPLATGNTTAAVGDSSSAQDRFHSFRRFATVQRATAKSVIYAKRAQVRAIAKPKTINSTTQPPSTTTRSYLKRIAASRLRLSRLAGTLKVGSGSSTTKPLSAETAAEVETTKRVAIRNLDKETRTLNDLKAGTKPFKAAAAKDAEDTSQDGVVTWESVRNNLQRFQVTRKRSQGQDQTTTAPTSTAAATTAVRMAQLKSRNRFANFKTQTARSAVPNRGQPAAAAATTTTTTTTAPSALQYHFQTLTNHSSPSTSHTSSLNSINLLNTASSAAPTKSQTDSASPTFLPFDKLTRAIVDDSILQNYRSSQATARSSNSYEAAATSRNAYASSAAPTVRPATVTTAAYGYGKFTAQTPFQALPSQRPQQHHYTQSLSTLPGLPTLGPPTPAPRIVIARAEGQRIAPSSDSITSILSSLAAQSHLKVTHVTPYVPLDDFLTKKFGYNAPPTIATNYVQNYPKVITTATTFLEQQRQEQQQQQQYKPLESQQQFYYQTPNPTQKTTYLPPPPTPPQTTAPKHQFFSQQQQQPLQQQQQYRSQQQPQPLLQQYQQQQQQQQQQPQQQRQHQPQQQQQQQPQQQRQHQPQQQRQQHPQQQQQQSLLQQYQQQRQPQQQQQLGLYQQQRQQQKPQQQSQPQNNYQQHPHQYQSQHKPATGIPLLQQQPFNTQDIFATYQQHQQQLPQFPPLGVQPPASQSQVLAGNNFNSRQSIGAHTPVQHLNVQLPALTNRLIPAPTTQLVAHRRSDAVVEHYQLSPTRSKYVGVSSYDVPLGYVGRLPNDITQFRRRPPHQH